MNKLLCFLLLTLGAWGQSIPSGSYYVPNYQYGLGGPATGGRVYSGNAAVGVSTITLYSANVALPNGHTIMPYATNAPIIVGTGPTQETVTPTAINGCYNGAPIGSCTITANFSFLHIQGEFIATGTYGLQEAINDALSAGGGTLIVDSTWQGATSTITNASGNTKVVIQDNRQGQTLYLWNGANYVPSNGTGVSPLFNIVSQTFNTTESFNNNSTQNTEFVLTLTGNVTSSSVVSNTAGQILEFVICQDATGSRTFAWPTNFNNTPTINGAANACTAAQFAYDSVTAKWQNTVTSAAAGGSVTSVGFSAPSTFSVSGTPITSFGTLGLTWSVGGADQLPLSTAANTVAFTGVPSCLDSLGQHLNYNTATHAFSCGTTSSGGGGGGTPGGTNGQLQFNSSAAFGGMTGSSVSGANLTLGGSLGVASATTFTGGLFTVTPSDVTTPAAIFNCANALTADCFDVEINGIKQFYIDSLGQANFQGSSATDASLIIANGAATPPNTQGNWWCIYPSCFYYDGTNTQQLATNFQANTFQQTQTMLAPNASSHALVLKAATAPTADLFQAEDSTATVQAKIDSAFSFWAPAYNTNGIRNGTFEFSAQNSDPATDCTGNPGTGKGCVDAQSIRLEAPATATSYRVILPATPPAAGSFFVTDGCPADANGTVKCTLTFLAPSTSGDVAWYNGTAWQILAGNSTATAKALTETSGTPSFTALSGTGTVTTTGTPASGNLAFFSGATSITNGNLSGDVTTSGAGVATIAANAVTSAKMAVADTIRHCTFDNDTQSATALTNAQITGRCMIPAAATIVEVDVWASGGTPSVMVEKISGGVHTNLLTTALATAASGGIACDSSNSACYGAQVKTAGIAVSSIAAGDIVDIASATAGGTATWFTVAVFYTIN